MSQEPTPTPTKDPAPEPTPDPTPDPKPTDPPEGDPPSGDPPKDEGKSYDEAYVKKLRTEAANRRTELREAQEKLEKLESEKLTETERTKQEATKATERAQALEVRVKRAEVRSAAAGKEFANPDLAADLIDPSKVELSEDGEITNGDELLDGLLEKYPDLKAKPDEKRPDELKQILKDGDLVKDGKQVYEGEAARKLLETDPDAFHKAMDEGRIKNV